MNKRIPDHYVQIILGVLGVIFLFLCFLLVREYNHLERQHIMSLYHSRISSMAHPLSTTDVTMIQSWMTFDYINVSFKIPPDVLKSALTITDTRYPHLSLNRYAKTASTTSAALTLEVQNAVQNFLATQK